MLNGLKNHPFAVEAFFETSTVLTFAIPKEELYRFVPAPLTLDTFQDKWAFLAVALVSTTQLRPAGMPGWMGNSFFLIGYRIFVRYQDMAGKNLRGLYILRSETDRTRMQLLGNLFTHYHYHKIAIQELTHDNTYQISAPASGLKIKVKDYSGDPALPDESPFIDWNIARRYAGPLPHNFTRLEAENAVLIVEGQRENWIPKPVQVIDYHIPFVQQLGLQHVQLASAFQIKNIPYKWSKGKIEPCR